MHHQTNIDERDDQHKHWKVLGTLDLHSPITKAKHRYAFTLALSLIRYEGIAAKHWAQVTMGLFSVLLLSKETTTAPVVKILGSPVAP